MSLEVFLNVSGPGLQVANTAEPTSFTISASDKSGRPLALAGNPFTVDIQGPGGKVQNNLADNGNGSWTVSYQAAVSGNHDVTVTLKQSVRVGIATGTDASKTKVYGPGLEDGVQDNLPTYFTIEAVGTDGKRMPKGGDPFTVKVTGPKGENVPANITDNGDGTYRVDYAPENAGPTRIDVGLKDKPVANSPYTVNVKEGADHSTSFVEAHQFVIRSKTKTGKNMTKGGETFTVSINGPSGEVRNNLKDVNDGTYVCNFSLPQGAKGRYSFSVQVNKKDIQGTPFTLNI